LYTTKSLNARGFLMTFGHEEVSSHHWTNELLAKSAPDSMFVNGQRYEAFAYQFALTTCQDGGHTWYEYRTSVAQTADPARTNRILGDCNKSTEQCFSFAGAAFLVAAFYVRA